VLLLQPSVIVSVVECCARVEAIEPQCPSIKIKICLNGKRDVHTTPDLTRP